MTRFFTSLILPPTLVFILGILLSGLVGRFRPAMFLNTFMTNPDGTACDRPCVFGIYPGVTTDELANHILDTHPLMRGSNSIPNTHLWLLSDKKTYLAIGLTENKLVDNVILTDTPADSGVPVPGALVDSSLLGEYILKFGKPIVGLPGSNYFVIEYPNMGIIAAVARPLNLHEFVAPESQMALLMISDLSACSKSFSLPLHHWLGFKKMIRYFGDNPDIRVVYRNSTLSYPPPYLHCADQTP